MEQLVKGQDVRDGAVFPLVWKKPDVTVYVRQASEIMDARMFQALPGLGRAVKSTYAGRSRTTVYGVLCLRQKEVP